MARDKKEDAQSAAAYRARLKARAAAGDMDAIAQIARARERRPLYYQRHVAAIRADPERLAKLRTRRAIRDRQRRRRLQEARGRDREPDERQRARQREQTRRYRGRLKARLSTADPSASELIARRRQQQRDSWQRRREKVNARRRSEYATRREQICALITEFPWREEARTALPISYPHAGAVTARSTRRPRRNSAST